MAIAANFPSIKPSLNLDFANVGRLDPRVTFARASTARYYDGVTTAKAEQNLLIKSQEFDNTFWTNSANNISVTANTEVAPDGTTTAETLTDNATNGSHRLLTSGLLSFAIPGSTTFALSVFLKKGTHNYAYIGFRDGGTSDRYIAAAFDLDLGTAGDTFNPGSGTLVGSTITSVGNGWYRCSVVGALSGTTNSNPGVIIGMATAATGISLGGFLSESYVGTGTTIYAWGAQLEQRSAVTAYTATTTQPITNYVPVLLAAQNNEARFDHTPTTGAALGLEIEEQRTNLQINSEDFTNADWSKGSNTTIIGNSIIAPNGQLTADTFGFTAITSGACQVQDNQSKAASSITYTGSIYVKASSGLFFHFYVDANGTANSGRVIVDTSTWSIFSVTNAGTFTNTSGTVTPVGNGWYRITCTTTSGTETNIRFNLYWSSSNSTVNFTPAGTEQVYIWGAQLEAGAFATSYIPTTTTALTRSADVASMTGTNFSSWYNAGEGTLYGESSSSRDTANRWPFGITDGSASNLIGLRLTSTQAQNKVTVSGVVQADIVVSHTTGIAKTALAYAANDFAASVNGGAVGTDTSGSVPVVSQFDIGRIPGGTAICGHIQRLAYYPVRLSDAQLQALTG